MWCHPLGEDLYKVGNIPFELYRIAIDDVVAAKAYQGFLLMEKVVHFSGNSVLRFMSEYPEILDKAANQLKQIGCDVEFAGDIPLIAIHVPVEVAYDSAVNMVRHLEEAGLGEYEEACISEVHKAKL